MYDNELKIMNLFSKLKSEPAVSFVDTSFLMRPFFTDYFYPILNKYNSINREHPFLLSIHPSCIKRLTNLCLAQDEENSKQAQFVLNLIAADLKKGHNFVLYSAANNANMLHADLLSSAMIERLKHNVLVFTQNMKLVRDLCSFNHLESCNGKPVAAYSFNYSGGVHKTVLCID